MRLVWMFLLPVASLSGSSAAKTLVIWGVTLWLLVPRFDWADTSLDFFR